jgi:hypothetical protein
VSASEGNGDVVFPPDIACRVSKTGVVTEETQETGKLEEARTPEGTGKLEEARTPEGTGKPGGTRT